jgi:hypothetical protein
MKGIVYHIPDPKQSGTNHGYVGVVKFDKGIHRRFIEHSKVSSHMRSKIKNNNIMFEDVIILFEGEIRECYNLENKLRPNQNIGWNVASGGGGPYYSEIEELNLYRSVKQKERMTDENIRKKQAETFKLNYYANDASKEIRSLRAKQHMSNEEKKIACVGAMHKKKKCLYCDYENNAGNVAIHMKKVHNNDNTR